MLGSCLQNPCFNAATPFHKADVKNLKRNKRVKKAFGLLFRCPQISSNWSSHSSVGSSGDLWEGNGSDNCPTDQRCVWLEWRDPGWWVGSNPPAQSGFTVRAEQSLCCHCVCSAFLCLWRCSQGRSPHTFYMWILEQATKVHGRDLGLFMYVLICWPFWAVLPFLCWLWEFRMCRDRKAACSLCILYSLAKLGSAGKRQERWRHKRWDQRKGKLSLTSLCFPHKKENFALWPLLLFQAFFFSSAPYTCSHTPTHSSPGSFLPILPSPLAIPRAPSPSSPRTELLGFMPPRFKPLYCSSRVMPACPGLPARLAALPSPHWLRSPPWCRGCPAPTQSTAPRPPSCLRSDNLTKCDFWEWWVWFWMSHWNAGQILHPQREVR